MSGKSSANTRGFLLGERKLKPYKIIIDHFSGQRFGFPGASGQYGILIAIHINFDLFRVFSWLILQNLKD